MIESKKYDTTNRFSSPTKTEKFTAAAQGVDPMNSKYSMQWAVGT